jgi:hypothetical protein
MNAYVHMYFSFVHFHVVEMQMPGGSTFREGGQTPKSVPKDVFCFAEKAPNGVDLTQVFSRNVFRYLGCGLWKLIS